MPRLSFTNFDRPYRRGVILGLSLAELFIILIFLLLLTMVGYATKKNIAITTAQQTTDELRDKLATVEKRSKRVKKQLGFSIEDDDISSLIVSMDKEIEKLRAERDEFRDALGTNATTTAIGEQVQSVAREKGVSLGSLLAILEKEGPDSPGQDSPCWYTMGKRPSGEDYERALYAFDVRISDGYILVKDIPTPSLEHQKQKEKLEFNRAALDRKLNYEEFIPAFIPFKLAGENKKIRKDRRCTFYVRVWDATSSTNKQGYKQAHNVIVQGVFNTYETRESIWPH